MGIFGAAFVSGLALTALRRMPWWWAAASAGAALAWRNAAQKKLQRQRLLEEEAAATHSAEPGPDLPELDTHLVQRWSATYFSAPAESPAPLEFASDIEVPTPAIELASEVTHDLQPAAHPPIEAPRPPSPWVLSVEPVPAWQDQPPAAADSRSSDLLARAPEGVEERESAPIESPSPRPDPASPYLPPISTGADIPDEVLITAEAAPMDPTDSDVVPEIDAPQFQEEPLPEAASPAPEAPAPPRVNPPTQKVLLRVPARLTPKITPAAPSPSPDLAAPTDIPPAPVILPRPNPAPKKNWLGWWK